jgi:hypothetical protein
MTTQSPEPFDLPDPAIESTPTSAPAAALPPSPEPSGTLSGDDYGAVGPPEWETTASAGGFGAAGPPEYGTTTASDGP